jgi:penicillin-binding protein 1A
MKGVVERGTGKRAKVLDRPFAAKTGTTDHSTDVWFIGSTPSLVAGVWIGYDTKRSLGPTATSGFLAVPIWMDFMRVIVRAQPREDFPVPAGVVYSYVNYDSGEAVSPDDPGAILEYFVQGTEPRVITSRSPAVAPPVQ